MSPSLSLGAVVCVCFCGLPMPPIGLIAAVHNNLSPLHSRRGKEEGRESGKTDERQGKTGERREE